MLELEVQRPFTAKGVPTDGQLQEWAGAVLAGRRERAELLIRIVDEAEGRALNSRYRGKDYPTNVLSFPSDLPEEVDSALLGDLVICAPVVSGEAAEQGKALAAHWAHMVVHGMLHLLGYDHRTEEEAERMEGVEVRILNRLGFADPYAER
jgi:probable rRNA maturation factor